MKLIQAPNPIIGMSPKVFLAGSIEMGRAEPWQDETAAAWSSKPGLLMNPRRDDWDNTWEQSINEPRFLEQVMWELFAQDQADRIFMYFAPNTKAPITLLEFGLAARSNKLFVCCPCAFYRRGNVEVVCAYYDIPLYDDLDTARSAFWEKQP